MFLTDLSRHECQAIVLPLGKSGMKVTDALCHFTIAV
jgi:hypothetical protein